MPELKANFKSVQSNLGGSLPGRLIFGIPGKDGGYYLVAAEQVDTSTIRFTYTPSKEEMPVVDPVNITLPNATGAGLTATEKTLILSLFQNAIFKSDVSAILEQLETLWSNSEDGGEDSGGTDTPTLYIVTNKLTNVTNSNSSASVASGGSYTATLTPVGGCELESVKVTMGGTDITDWAYSGGVVNIASVTGNVVITATAKSSSNVTQDGSTLIIVAVPNVAQNGTTLTIS